MAEKRMFTSKIIESDAFLDLPLSAQALYLHLNMNADDDGFVNNAKMITRVIGAKSDDLQILIDKAFVLLFPSGVIVVKGWLMNNSIKADRKKPTSYQEELSMLDIKDNRSYTWKHSGNELETLWKQNGNKTETEWKQDGHTLEHRLDKDRLDKTRLDKSSVKKHQHGEYKNVLLSDEELEKLKAEFPNDYQQRIERVSEYCASTGKSYKNYLATIRNWAKKDTPKEEPKRKSYEEQAKEWMNY